MDTTTKKSVSCPSNAADVLTATCVPLVPDVEMSSFMPSALEMVEDFPEPDAPRGMTCFNDVKRWWKFAASFNPVEMAASHLLGKCRMHLSIFVTTRLQRMFKLSVTREAST